MIDNQTVTISGGIAPIVFAQNPISSGNLWVNDQIGSSAQPLENYHKLMTPTAAGHIDVTVQMQAGSDSLVLAGLAIREAGFLVNSTADGDDMNAANGVTTLREAIRMANTTAGADTISFADNLSGQTINLGGAELAITEAVTIDGAPLAQNVTINAQQLSRIFHITADTGDFTLAGLTLTGGRTTGNNGPFTAIYHGGAIRSVTSGLLTIKESTISGNSTTGDKADGGGIYAANLTLTQSTVSGNSTAGSNALGGGIFASTLSLVQSTVSGNGTTGAGANGGGIFASYLTIALSTVTGNHVTGIGGGIYKNNPSSNSPLSISGSILSGNTATGGNPDLRSQGNVTVNRSLIGTGVIPNAGSNNISTNNPLLGPLADNGGPTKTHALLVGSPAIDAGDPAITTGVDQRGLLRVVDGDGVGGARVDIGAYELQGPGFPLGDYNHNSVVDAPDYVLWRKTLGQTGPGLLANGDDTGASQNKIDQADYIPWRAHFGNTTGSGAGAGEGEGAALDTASTMSNSDETNSSSSSSSEKSSDNSGENRSVSFAFAPTDSGAVRSSSTRQRYSFVAAPLAVANANSNQLFLALDRALAELNHDSESLRASIDANGPRREQESASSPDASLAVAWMDLTTRFSR